MIDLPIPFPLSRQYVVDAREDLVLSGRVSFKSLNSKPDMHHGHCQYTRGVTHSRTSGRLITCCPVEWSPTWLTLSGPRAVILEGWIRIFSAMSWHLKEHLCLSDDHVIISGKVTDPTEVTLPLSCAPAPANIDTCSHLRPSACKTQLLEPKIWIYSSVGSVLLYSPGWLRTYGPSVSASLNWNYRHAPLHSLRTGIVIKLRHAINTKHTSDFQDWREKNMQNILLMFLCWLAFEISVSNTLR